MPDWFTFLDADELQVWESQHVTASARIPASIAVTTTDRVQVLNPSDPELGGPWRLDDPVQRRSPEADAAPVVSGRWSTVEAVSKNWGVLDNAELEHIAVHSLQNFEALLAEAELLFEHEHWARAGALAVLGVEESGKAHLCHVWAFHPPAHGDWFQFWDTFKDHPSKFDLWLTRLDTFGSCPDVGMWKREAKIAHLSKLNSLYVGWEGQVLTPLNITEDDSMQFIEIARETLGYWKARGWRSDP
ncbi:MAG: AbiV family abortive infection protein [Actinomycetota bacterium]